MVCALRLVGEIRQVFVVVGRNGGLKGVALAQAGHLALPAGQGGLVLRVGLRGLFSIASWEARVDFAVNGAAEGFADALGVGLVGLSRECSSIFRRSTTYM